MLPLQYRSMKHKKKTWFLEGLQSSLRMMIARPRPSTGFNLPSKVHLRCMHSSYVINLIWHSWDFTSSQVLKANSTSSIKRKRCGDSSFSLSLFPSISAIQYLLPCRLCLPPLFLWEIATMARNWIEIGRSHSSSRSSAFASPSSVASHPAFFFEVKAWSRFVSIVSVGFLPSSIPVP